MCLSLSCSINTWGSATRIKNRGVFAQRFDNGIGHRPHSRHVAHVDMHPTPEVSNKVSSVGVQAN